MSRSGVDLCLDVHADFVAPYAYVDAVEAYLATPRRLLALRERFEAALLRRSPDFQTDRRYVWETPPSKPLLLSMCGPSVSARFGALAMTFELPISDFDRRPDPVAGWSPARSKALGRAAALAMADLVDDMG